MSGLLLAAWVMVAARGPEVRAVIPGDHACSEIQASVGRAALSMKDRAEPDQDFSIRVCSAEIPKDSADIMVDGTVLKGFTSKPKRIVILGDTGCRLKGQTIQACNDPQAWPLEIIAQAAANEHPDLVIHVGDYHYRESACPEGDSRCQGTPWGDNWATWAADFINPAQKLLSAAPWVMVRGNHEECRRAGRGWTLLLAPVAAPNGCLEAHPPYRVDLGSNSLYVVDDNDASDFLADGAASKRLHKDFATIPGDQPVWLLTHHPWHGVVRSALGLAQGSNATLTDAWEMPFPASVQLLLSGHIHVWQVETFDGGHPPQIIAGTGGDLLDQGIPADLAGLTNGGWHILDGHSTASFGYAVLDHLKGGWFATVHKPDGSILEQCRLEPGKIECVSK